MKLKIYTIFITFLSLFAWSSDQLEIHSFQKEKNYEIIDHHYQELKFIINKSHSKQEKFCELNELFYDQLVKILNDDNEFILYLSSSIRDVDKDYRFLLEENKMTPLLSFYSRKTNCDTIENINWYSQRTQLNNDLKNLQYLKLTHALWKESL